MYVDYLWYAMTFLLILYLSTLVSIKLHSLWILDSSFKLFYKFDWQFLPHWMLLHSSKLSVILVTRGGMQIDWSIKWPFELVRVREAVGSSPCSQCVSVSHQRSFLTFSVRICIAADWNMYLFLAPASEPAIPSISVKAFKFKLSFVGKTNVEE